MKRNPLNHFEALAQYLFEDTLRRLLGGRVEPLEVANAITRVLEDSQATGHPATVFNVYLHPKDLAVVEKQPDAAKDLAQLVARLAQEAELDLPAKPEVYLHSDATLNRGQVSVSGSTNSPAPMFETLVYTSGNQSAETLMAIKARDAFLIVNGQQHIPLERALTTIGRRLENDIVLDSPSVSRYHAQIRWRFGHFILYDVSSRGHTMVNDAPVREDVLRAGDVIALSDQKLIYAEGYAGRPTLDEQPTEADNLAATQSRSLEN